MQLNHEESSLYAKETLYHLITQVRAIEELHEARLADIRAYDISINAANRNLILEAIFSLPHRMSWQFLESE